MKIRSQSNLITGFLFLLVMGVSGFVYLFSGRLENNMSKNDMAYAISESVFDLSVVNDNFLHYRNKRSEEQWRTRYASLNNLLASSTKYFSRDDERLITTQLRKNQGEIRSLSHQMIARLNLPAGDGPELSDALLSNLDGQIAEKFHVMISDASSLLAISLKSQRADEERMKIVIWIFVSVMVVIIIGFSLWIRRNILRPISRLRSGAKAIASGNLDYKLKSISRNEIGDLSRGFDQMTVHLRAITVSRNKLDEEITTRVMAEEALRKSQSRLSGILDIAHEGIISIDESQRIIIFNKGAEEIFGYSQKVAIGQPIDLIIPERFNQSYYGQVKELGHDSYDARLMRKRREIVGIRKNGEEFPAEATLSKLESGGEKIYTVVLRDISERKQAEEALTEQAFRDSLTNLYNRRYFNNAIVNELARAERNKQSFAILMCDLDGFKAINDEEGRLMGDVVLKKVAQVLREATRGADLVFRWGGDEFVVLLSNTTRDGIMISADRIRKGLREIKGHGSFGLDMSFGVSFHPEHGRDLDELIRIADRALYVSKRGGDRIHIGDEEYHLDESIIKVVFQPIVDIRSNKILGYEALSRDAVGRLNILNLFKKYQAVGRLSELKKICYVLQMKTAREKGLRNLFINVDFDLLGKLDCVPKPPGMDVYLEISEVEALHDIKNNLRIAKRWRKHGYKFAIDDFGAGFISLPFIAQLVPDYIKLDRATILQAVESRDFKRVMKHLLLGLQNCSAEGIIAEGIELEAELKVMKQLGVHFIQGYLMGKPRELKALSVRENGLSDTPEKISQTRKVKDTVGHHR